MAIVTISRKAKSGGTVLAEKLASRLGCKYLSREILLEATKEHNIDESKLQEGLQTPPPFLNLFSKDRYRYLATVQNSLLRAVKNDNVIYDGLAGQVFLKKIRQVLKIRIEFPFDRRIANVMREMGLARGEAATFLVNADKQRERWIQYLYGMSWDDQSLYDITINLANVGYDTACDTICNALEHREFQITKDAQRRLQDLALECEVKSALSLEDKLWDQPLTVEATGGTVRLGGHVKKHEQRAQAQRLVGTVRGIERLETTISLTSRPLQGMSMSMPRD